MEGVRYEAVGMFADGVAFTFMFTPCSVAEETQWALPYQGDPVTIRVMGWETYSDYNWENEFASGSRSGWGNVTIEVEIPVSDTGTLLDLYLSSGSDMPDIMMYRDPDMFMQNYGDGGRTLNLLDYAEYMPGYMERREQYPHLSRYDTEDGKCYMLFPCLSDRISEVWYQNQDLMDKYGLETPTYLGRDESLPGCRVRGRGRYVRHHMRGVGY